MIFGMQMELSKFGELYNIKTNFLVYAAFFRDLSDTEEGHPEILTPKHDC